MAGLVTLNTVVNANFVNRFLNLAQSSAGGASSAGNPTAAKVSISDSLRFGAHTFGTAVQNLNSAASMVNLSLSTLRKLSGLTDKMIELADRASQSGTGSATREDLDAQFHDLGNKFEKIVTDAHIGDRKYLTTDGLDQIFQLVGLDKNTSASIAQLFKQFITPTTDTTLASEDEKGSRPVVVSPSSYHGQASDTAYSLKKVTDIAPTGNGYITTVNNVTAGYDTGLNQNPSYQSAVITNVDATMQTFRANYLTTDVSVMAVNKADGHVVVKSTQDFLGSNPSGAENLFLVDTSGTVVSQMTQNSDVTQSIESVSLSSDNTTVGYIQTAFNGGFNTYEAYKTVNGSSTTLIDSVVAAGFSVASLGTLRMSEDGSAFAYTRTTAFGFPDTIVYSASTGSETIPGGGVYGFIDNNTIAFAPTAGGTVSEYTLGSGGVLGATLASGLTNVTDISTVQGTGGNPGYFATTSDDGSGGALVSLYQAGNSTAVTSYDIQAGDLLATVSLAYNTNGRVDVGMLASMPSLGGDSDTELYRLTANTQSTTGHRDSPSSGEFQSIFDPSNNIRTRGNATRVLVDLKALKEQITKNQKGLGKAIETIQKNLTLARGVGLAFLDLSSQIKTSTDADKLANKLQDAIRANAGQAIGAVENLNNIVVAALAFEQGLNNAK